MGRVVLDTNSTSLVPSTGTPGLLTLPALAPPGDPRPPHKSFVFQSRDPALLWEHRSKPLHPPKTGSGCGAAGRTDATGQLPQHRLLPLKTYNLHKTAIVKPSHRAVRCRERGRTHPRQSKTNPKVWIQQRQAEPGGDVPGQQALPAGAGLCDHVLILLVEDATVTLDHEDADGAVTVGDTGGPGNIGIHQLMDKALHHSVVGRMVVVAEQAGTGTLAVARVVAVGSDDPVVPAQLGKADGEGVQRAVTLLPSLLPKVARQVVG